MLWRNIYEFWNDFLSLIYANYELLVTYFCVDLNIHAIQDCDHTKTIQCKDITIRERQLHLFEFYPILILCFFSEFLPFKRMKLIANIIWCTAVFLQVFKLVDLKLSTPKIRAKIVTKTSVLFAKYVYWIWLILYMERNNRI